MSEVGEVGEFSVQSEAFDVGAEIAHITAGRKTVGAVASFVGLVRDGDGPEDVKLTAMTLEHYPGMTEAALEDIVAQAKARWQLQGVRVIHRTGRLAPGDAIVLVIAASAHRGDAFAACEFIMDYLKTRAPFWKKEETRDGSRWVEAKDADDAAAGRW